MKTIKDNKRRDFMKVLGMSAIATATTAIAGGRGGQGGGRSKEVTELTEHQLDELFHIFQEEKVARDVYITLGRQYPDEKTFAQIQISEQEHMLAAQVLCERYGIDTSDVDISLNDDAVGQFVLHEMQVLYNSCIELGSVSHLEAVKVGELVELTDIKDIEIASEGMPADVVRTYDNLKAGSYEHLDAYRNAIARLS